MKTVAIIGAGETAAHLARTLAPLEVAGEIRLIDPAAQVALGKALDIQQSGPIGRFDTRVRGAADLSAAAGAAVVVLADPHGAGPDHAGAIETVRRLAAVAPRAPLVFARPDDHLLLVACVRELRLPPARFVGAAPEALAAAARALVALAADASPVQTWLPVHGVPNQWVFGWSEASIAGRPASAVLPAHELAAVERRIRASWPPGPYALGSAAAHLTAAMLARSRRRFTAFAVLDGEWRHRAAAVRVVLGPDGIVTREEPVLSARERVQLATALSG